MAEASEAAPKASEFFLGVVDLFGILLPGALTSLILGASFHLYNLEKLKEMHLNITHWVLLLVIFYIVGHLVSGLGGWLLDPLYDGFYKQRFIGGMPSLRRRAERAAFKILGSEFYTEEDNRLEWSEALTRLNSPGTSAHIDHLEADSKFFRSIVVTLILTWPGLVTIFDVSTKVWLVWGLIVFSLAWYSLSVTDNVKDRGRSLNKKTKTKLGKENKLRLDWPDQKWLSAEAEIVTDEWKTCQTEATWLTVLWVFGGLSIPIAAACRCDYWPLGIALLWMLLLWFVFMRYMALRAKRTRLTYMFAVLSYRLISLTQRSTSA